MKILNKFDVPEIIWIKVQLNRYVQRVLGVFWWDTFASHKRITDHFCFYVRELFGKQRGRGAPALNYLTSQWAASEQCDGQARPLQHGPPPYDSVFYSVFRAAASHVVFLQDQISESLVCSHCTVASTAADTTIGVCYGLDRGKENGYLKKKKKKVSYCCDFVFFLSLGEKKRVCLYLDFE